jgi:beta-galactosidase
MKTNYSTYGSLISRLLLAAGIATSALAGPPTSTETRQRLSAGWEHYQGSLGSPWEVWRGEKASDNVTWKPVTLPHCFNARDAVDPDVRYYQGPGWYRTRLKIANPHPQGRTLLHFEGAGQKSRVFVHLEEVGGHVGGYDEWTLDITDAVAKAVANGDLGGEVPLAVTCDNSRDAEMIPSDLSDFNRYGGLYRHLSLVHVPAVSLDRVHLQPTVTAEGASVKVRARLRNPTAITDPVELRLQFRDPQGNEIHAETLKLSPWEGEKEIADVRIAAPELWSPASPRLYRSAVTISSAHGEQQVEERFGLRTAEWVDHGPFKLNGERLLLRGTHYHEDHAGVAAAVPDDVVRTTLAQIKAMGANFVRLGHYQQAPLVLDLCDELGLLVWEEIPWCRGGLGGEAYRQQCRDMLRAMIDQHSNHPSIILWGMGNENDWPGDFEVFDKDAIRAFMAELNALSHELDPSRPTAIRRCDFCKELIDVYSPSIWAGWYSGRYTEYRAATEKAIKDTPHFFHAEWGGDSHAGRFSESPEKMIEKVATGEGTAEKGKAYKSTGGKVRMSKDGDWSESYMVNLFDWHLKEQEQMDRLTGSAAWIFKDFATPLRPENPVPRVNQKGVVERDGTPKESYYVFQSYWSDVPMLHIYGHGWQTRWGAADEEKQVRVYSNCPEAELFVNGRSAGTRKRDSADFPGAGLRWNVVLREGQNTLRAVGRRGGVEVVDEITTEYQTATWGKPAKLMLTEVGRTDGRVMLEARAFDKDGVPCPDAANVVRFGLLGDGRLVDNLGTVDGSRVVQLANGRARITLEFTGSKAVAHVASEGLKSAFLTILKPKADGSAAAPAAAAAPVAGLGAAPAKTPPAPKLTIDVGAIDRDRILRAAEKAIGQPSVTITAFPAKLSEGGLNDFYSNGDYWWPDPTKPNGLPYIKRDGETNPENFLQHRLAVKALRDSVAALAAAYRITGDDRYVATAVPLLEAFFLDPATRMNPSLTYAQAIPGVSPGRGIGIIDALHLIEVPAAIKAMEGSKAFPPEMAAALRGWFRQLADWMVTSKNGKDEAKTKNNHAVAYFLQLAAYADFVGDEEKLAECRRRFKEVFVAEQMAADGSFPLEMARTKPYGYSIFQLDNMTMLCQLLSTDADNLWEFTLPDGRGIRKAVAFLNPYIADKTKWQLKPDVQAWEGWPARQPHLLFAGLAFGEQGYLDLWRRLPADPTDAEVQRNIGITQPILWLR